MSPDEEELELEESTEEEDASDLSSIAFPQNEFADLYTSRQEISAPTRCEFVSGAAGVGKTFEILRRCEDDPSYAILSASTGVAAVNLNATTIHSLLGFFDYDSLRDAYLRKSAQQKLRSVVTDGYRNVVIDEVSMIPHYTLDTLIHIFDDVNENLKESQHPVGLILVGDVCQLPPIPERGPKGKPRVVPWCFDATCWPRFEENTTRLTQNWRQSDLGFLLALSHARAGRGEACVAELVRAGAQFETVNDMEFDGTTILAENKHVDTFNSEALKRVQGRDMYLPSRRWGKERGEWKNIPLQTHVREGAYVMLLANAPGVTRGTFEYVNGDCGHIRGITQRQGAMPTINIELVRTGKIVQVPPIVRGVDYREKPDGFSSAKKTDESYYPAPHYANLKKRWVAGQMQYYPLRLAYATTCQKAQGLTLDRCQVDLRTWQFGNPGMTYISMSRCRSLEGLRLVGMKEVVARNCKVDPRVLRWI